MTDADTPTPTPVAPTGGKILFLADVPAHRPESGAEQVLFQQSRGCARLGLEVCAITRDSAITEPRLRSEEGVSEACFPADPARPFSFLQAIGRYPGHYFRHFAATGSFTLLVAHQPFCLLPLLRRNVSRPLPLLYVFHSPGHEEYNLAHGHRPWWQRALPALLRRQAERYCIRQANQVMTLSRFMADRAAAIHRLDSGRILINPGGVDLQRFQPPVDRTGLQKRLGLVTDRIQLLTIRNFEPRMGIDNLLYALKLLNGRGRRFHLTLGGSGPEKPRLEQLIDSLDLRDQVTCTGFIPAGEMANRYGAADFFILPTRELEGFGLVTPEAMACGTPVLGTPVGGTREILGRFDRNFLFADTSPQAMAAGIEECLRRYPSTSPQYRDLRRRCRRFIGDHYSWQRHVSRLHTALSALTQPGR